MDQSLKDRVLAGDPRALARAASLVENQTQAGKELIDALFPFTGRAMIVGVTGPSGAGKSTLVDQLAKVIRATGRIVAILAIDPSSPYSQGAILGDRIRMQSHSGDAGVFIRSIGTRGRLGGVSQSTLDAALLFDAAGRDVVIIETIGVGQDEIEIAQLADVVVVVLVPGLGDDVQALKAGLMEIADIFAINKDDLPGADRLEQEIRALQSFGDPEARQNAAPIRRVSAAQEKGIQELLQLIESVFLTNGRKNSRASTWSLRLAELVRERMMSGLAPCQLEVHAQRVASREESPNAAVEALLEQMSAG